MSLKDQLAEDLKDAMRQGDETRKTALRLTITAIKNAEVAAIKQFEDAEVIGVIGKQAKQRRESIEEYQKANRQDLADKEAAELKVLETYLPAQMSREDVAAEASKVIAEVGAKGPADKGRVMAALMPRLAGRADGKVVNEAVTELLSNL
ncbi:MAG TPA: GatB/YqeY domain-containing protein [Dehalococcoidia bacterium]|nr:GatB/YqeY domain-containing protein [Dehalococcoidia bacterium]